MPIVVEDLFHRIRTEALPEFGDLMDRAGPDICRDHGRGVIRPRGKSPVNEAAPQVHDLTVNGRSDDIEVIHAVARAIVQGKATLGIQLDVLSLKLERAQRFGRTD